MLHNQDTIAAISTPHGNGGIGIIRISGKSAFFIANEIFEGRKRFDEIKTHTINYGRIKSSDTDEILDEVLISKMRKPNTFTREDVVEINCHGGTVILKKILELILKKGARLAEPGEFTKRAFLNGRLDLSQAEAVIDLINAKTYESSKAAIDQLEGKLSLKLKDARSRLIELLAHIEVTVDYPEHDIEEITGQKIYSEIKDIKEKLKSIIKNFEKGRIIREGINAVIVGRPNVGKSSLLNELTGKSRAIVTDIPGTTRDIIEEYINLNGVPVRIIDTAGIRETEDVVEKIGVEKTHREVESADLIIMMLDGQQGMDENDLRIINSIKDKKAIIILNKIDLVDEDRLVEIESKIQDNKVIRMSLKDEIGITELSNAVVDMFIKGEVSLNSEILITNIRHKNLIDKAIESIDYAIDAHERGMPLDMITVDIVDCAQYLGEVTGESVSEDVMNEIFSRFCLGK